MRFWKENSYHIVRLFIIQIVMAIFGSVLHIAVFTAASALVPLISVFCILFYLFVLYSVTWEYGAKEYLRVSAGRAKQVRLKGLYMILLAEIPNFVLSLMMLISGLANAVGVYFVPHIIESLIASPYFGVVDAICGDATHMVARGLGYLVATLPAVLTVTFAYFLGVNNRRILPVSRPGNSAAPKRKD